MAWNFKARGASSGYYYRSIRVGGRRHKIYFGTGIRAEAAAEEDLRRRQAREALWEERLHLEAADALLDDLLARLDLLVRVRLLLGGYYEHYRTWRLRRQTGTSAAAAGGIGEGRQQRRPESPGRTARVS